VLIQTKTGATPDGPNLSPERIVAQLARSIRPSAGSTSTSPTRSIRVHPGRSRYPSSAPRSKPDRFAATACRTSTRQRSPLHSKPPTGSRSLDPKSSRTHTRCWFATTRKVFSRP
jgi:hypothetical protein